MPPVCALTPAAGCQASASGKGKIGIIDGSPELKDKVSWKWTSSADTFRPDFGDPLTMGATDFALCIYDGGGLRSAALIPAGGTCSGIPCWKDVGTVKYGNKTLLPHGIQKATFKPGVALKAKIGVKGKGDNLYMPPLPLVGTITVQLTRLDSTICWETTHSTTLLNDGFKLKAKSD